MIESIFNRVSQPTSKGKKGRRKFFITTPTITKRQRFILSISILTALLFFSEQLQITKSGIYLGFALGILTNILLYWSNYRDLRENFTWHIFLLPFFYSASFALFYLLVPNRLLTRIIMSSLYGVGLYSLFLCQNIFIIASIRTIALLTSARTVSFIITLVTFFFLTNTLLSFHLHILALTIFFFIYAFFLITHSLWIYTLESSFFTHIRWSTLLSLSLAEVAAVLWFWPSNPTVISLFLTGFFYTVVSLSHIWAEKRLFRGVL